MAASPQVWATAAVQNKLHCITANLAQHVWADEENRIADLCTVMR